MNFRHVFCVFALSLTQLLYSNTIIWQEAESFENIGGWSNDPQHIDIMGSPYLLATGVGTSVKDATTTVNIPETGEYKAWVRCRDWYPSHSPGQFKLAINDKESLTFGKASHDRWQWVEGGHFQLTKGSVTLKLIDTTGWWGRIDAIVLSKGDFIPSNDLEELNQQRIQYNGVSTALKDMGQYDVIVVGGGSAGMGAAISAARHGSKVAFIHDRKLIGGNGSSEIMVPPMGHIGKSEDKVNVTGLAEELYPTQGWTNFGNSEHYEKVIRAEKNIHLFLETRGIDVIMKNNDTIESVVAIDINSGQRMKFQAPYIIDTTGHGWIGYYAGAEYRMGTEARSEFNESMAPIKANDDTMGNSIYKITIKKFDTPQPFTTPKWAYQWTSDKDFDGSKVKRIKEAIRPAAFDKATRGNGRRPRRPAGGFDWFMETGGTMNTITDAEKIRDELFRIHLGVWGFQKNYQRKEKYAHDKIVWMNYVPGVRESRRLMGDYIMTQKDFDDQILHPDTIAFTDWGIDDHHPHGFFTKGIDVMHVYHGRRVSIPYRSLYSKNIKNLFMAGRCMSASHLALGGVRVQRPMLATGQVVGLASALAKQHQTTPRGIYENHIHELQQKLLKDGCFLIGIKNSDEKDLALKAKTSTPSINDGWNREVANKSNSTPWRASPIELSLAQPSVIEQIHLSLENRHHYVHFDIEALIDEQWKVIRSYKQDHKSRRYVLDVPTTETQRLRFKLKRSSGPVGICEIRVY